MPLYDYGCKSCGKEKEVQHPISEIGKIKVICDVCGQPMKKLLSAPTLLGFDDVGRSISKKDASTKSEKKSTKKSESKKIEKKDAA